MSSENNTKSHVTMSVGVEQNATTKYSILDMKNKKIWLVLVVFATGLLLTWISTINVKNGIDEHFKQEFDLANNKIISKIHTRLSAHAQLLRSGSAFIEGSNSVERKEWRTYYEFQRIEKNLPGIQGFGYSIIIPPNQLAQHEQKMRKEGFPEYAVKPVGKRETYTSIIYLEPFSGNNLRAFGYDMFSEPVRRKAMEYARDYDIESLTDKVTLVQETEQDVQAGTLMYVPVYNPALPVKTIEERRNAILGWVYSPYRMKDLMKGIIDSDDVVEAKQLQFEIYDDSSFHSDGLLYNSRLDTHKNTNNSPILIAQSKVVFNNQVWYLRFSGDEFLLSNDDYSEVWIVAVGGIVVTVFLCIIILLLINTSNRAQALAEILTKDLKESEEKYRVVFNNEIYAICIFDLTTLKLLDVNDAYSRIYGYSREELLSMTIHDITAEHQASDAATTKATNEGTTFIPLRYHRKKNGTIFPVEIVGGPYVWSGRNVMFALAHDITKRKAAEEALRVTEAKYRGIIEQSLDGTVITNEEGNIVVWNKSMESITGIQQSNAIGMPLWEIQLQLIPKEQATLELLDQLKSGLKNILEQKTNWPGLIRDQEILCVDGTQKIVQDSSFIIKTDNAVNFCTIFRDITERKRAEESLRASKDRFKNLFVKAPLGIGEIDSLTGKIYEVNPMYAKITGRTIEEMVHIDWMSITHPDDIQKDSDKMALLNSGKISGFQMEKRYLHKDGTVVWINMTITPLAVEDKSNPRHLCMIENITDRKRAEKKIYQLSQAVEQSPVSIVITDTTGAIEYANPKFVEITGYSLNEVIGKNPRVLQSGSTSSLEYKKLWDTLLSGGEWQGEFHNRKKNGDLYWEYATISPIVDDLGKTTHYLAVKEDITERKHAEEKLLQSEKRLRQSERMEAIGQLAGGIAHDFNNILTGIIGYTSMSQRHAENNPALKKNLDKVLAASDRAKHLTQQILSFSRQNNQEKVITSIKPIVKEVIDLLKASIPSSVKIESDLQEETKPIMVDSTKIHEVILNLATNAVHAMKNKGTLTIRLYTELFEQAKYVVTGELPPGEYSVIEVADTGYGMDSNTISKSFEPFFTTKAVGEGTGMGLSVVLGIIQSHDGNIEVESVVGKGTTFKIYLPVAEGAVSGAKKIKSKLEISGIERILFVDDEQMLRDLAETEFTYLGYTVTCKENGREALEFFEKNESEIDILITDQTMPELTGIELSIEALKIRKDLPIILCTGFSNVANPESAKAAGVSRFIMKPYNSYEISKLIRDIFDNKKKESGDGKNTGN